MPDSKHRGRRIELAQQHGQQGNNLCQGVRLAEDARLEVAHANAGVQDGRDHDDSQVATENQNGHPAGNQPFMMQHQEQGAEQKLVRYGIEILPKDGSLLQPSGQQTIEAVRDAGEHEERKRRAEVAVENGQHQEWNDAQAQKRELIRGCAKLVHGLENEKVRTTDPRGAVSQRRTKA